MSAAVVDGLSVTLRIDNDYSDGHHSEHEVTVPGPGDGDLEAWWDTEVWNQTGDGHGAGDSHLGSCYTATVLATSDPRVAVGDEREWLS